MRDQWPVGRMWPFYTLLAVRETFQDMARQAQTLQILTETFSK